MLEDLNQLQKTIDKIVADMLAANIAQKKTYTDNRVEKEYWNLITPDAFDKKLIVIAVIGYPERAGIWSNTLLRQSRIAETSMEPYFRQFSESDIGLVAIDPNCFEPDIEGDTFIYQLERVIADIPANTKIGLLGFSMGGKILVEFLQQRPELLTRIAGLALIDPTLPNRLRVGNIRPLLDNDTLLIASEGEVSPGEISSMLLRIPKISFPGIHGEMPNKALKEVIKFYEQRSL
ncbi:MAG: alpha/beta hydrolase [Planctomycetes bacterium]|nr:alpha/beta hydrolase [Planctomycetota bacterium]